MFGPRILFGAVVGGALVYFLDPQQGARRRERVRAWWEQNRETPARFGEQLQSRLRRDREGVDEPEPSE